MGLGCNLKSTMNLYVRCVQSYRFQFMSHHPRESHSSDTDDGSSNAEHVDPHFEMNAPASEPPEHPLTDNSVMTISNLIAHPRVGRVGDPIARLDQEMKWLRPCMNCKSPCHIWWRRSNILLHRVNVHIKMSYLYVLYHPLSQCKVNVNWKYDVVTMLTVDVKRMLTTHLLSGNFCKHVRQM